MIRASFAGFSESLARRSRIAPEQILRGAILGALGITITMVVTSVIGSGVWPLIVLLVANMLAIGMLLPAINSASQTSRAPANDQIHGFPSRAFPPVPGPEAWTPSVLPYLLKRLAVLRTSVTRSACLELPRFRGHLDLSL